MSGALSEGLIHAIKISRGGPLLSHLLFADDCLLFAKARTRGAGALKAILEEYGRCSGQLINYDKSSAIFSANVKEDDRKLISEALSVHYSNNPERYSGVPNMVGRNKKLAFQSLKDKFKQKIDSWSIRFLSQGGWNVFIKSILRAIPTHSMLLLFCVT